MECEKDLNIVTKKLTNDLNERYGKNWNYLLFLSENYAEINIDRQKEKFIYFILKILILLYIKFTHFDEHTIDELIVEAQNNSTNICTICERMSNNTKNDIIFIAKNKIKVLTFM